jgi:hypothetical protein
MGRFISSFFVIFIILLAAFVYWKFYFVFGEGAKAGELNFLVKKGYVFKTWEGKLVQAGLRSQSPNTIQSYEFEFSVANDEIAKKLMSNEGRMVNLHYKEYKGSLPWRGHSAYIVDSVISIADQK